MEHAEGRETNRQPENGQLLLGELCPNESRAGWSGSLRQGLCIQKIYDYVGEVRRGGSPTWKKPDVEEARRGGSPMMDRRDGLIGFGWIREMVTMTLCETSASVAS